MSQDVKTHALEVAIKAVTPPVSALVKKTVLDSVTVHAEGLAVVLVHHAADLVVWDVLIVVLAHAPIVVQVLAWVVVCILVCLVLYMDKKIKT